MQDGCIEEAARGILIIIVVNGLTRATVVPVTKTTISVLDCFGGDYDVAV